MYVQSDFLKMIAWSIMVCMLDPYCPDWQEHQVLQVATALLQMIKTPREGFTTRSRVVPTSKRWTPFTTLQLQSLCKPISRRLADYICCCRQHTALLCKIS